jgi:hypothetical protein
MSRFSDSERAEIIRKSREILERGDAPPPPAPPVREVVVPESDAVAEWAEWHDARDREREINRAGMRRESAAAARAQTADRAAIDTLAAELAALRRDFDAQAEAGNAVARGLIDFSNSVTTRLHALAALTDRLERVLGELKTTYADGFAVLNARLVSAEAAHARESAFQGRQLAAARAELDGLVGQLNRERAEEQTNAKLAHLTESVDNVVRFVTAGKPDGAA